MMYGAAARTHTMQIIPRAAQPEANQPCWHLGAVALALGLTWQDPSVCRRTFLAVIHYGVLQDGGQRWV
jgi:hypothetical protein